MLPHRHRLVVGGVAGRGAGGEDHPEANRHAVLQQLRHQARDDVEPVVQVREARAVRVALRGVLPQTVLSNFPRRTLQSHLVYQPAGGGFLMRSAKR